MTPRPVSTTLLLLGCLFGGPQPCPAAPPSAGPVLVADNSDWGVSRVLARFRTRSGVVQLCTACMALGLFILMRKFAEPSRAAGRNAPPDSMED